MMNDVDGRAITELGRRYATPVHRQESTSMIRALYTAASGMNAQQANIDNVAHNLANVNTAGFKKSRVEFEDLVYQQTQGAGLADVDDRRGADRPRDRASAPARWRRRATSAPATCASTGGPLDLAIEGDGFFQVDAADGDDRLHARRHAST